MNVKLIVKNNYKTINNEITAWIQKNKNFNDCLKKVFQFFKDNVKISNKKKFRQFYKIKSNNPAIMFSLLSPVQKLILETYISDDNSEKIEESSKLRKS